MAQQRLHFLRVIRKNNICEKLLVTFNRSSIECILTYCITLLFSHCTEADREGLQRVVKTAEEIIGCPLPSLQDLYSSRCLTRAQEITRDSTILHTTCLTHYPLAGTTGPSEPEQTESDIASSHKPSLH